MVHLSYARYVCYQSEHSKAWMDQTVLNIVQKIPRVPPEYSKGQGVSATSPESCSNAGNLGSSSFGFKNEMLHVCAEITHHQDVIRAESCSRNFDISTF